MHNQPKSSDVVRRLQKVETHAVLVRHPISAEDQSLKNTKKALDLINLHDSFQARIFSNRDNNVQVSDSEEDCKQLTSSELVSYTEARLIFFLRKIHILD